MMTEKPPASETRDWSVMLLGGFGVSSGGSSVRLPNDAQRLVAFLALHARRLPRAYIAGTLWIESTQDRASGNLRTALWRLRQRASDLIDGDIHSLAICSTATIDVRTLIDTADRLCNPDPDCSDIDLDSALLTEELLPGWYDEWTLLHRERLRQRSLHGLEALADRLADRGLHGPAIQAALAAIALDPLRESPHRCLVRAHIAEGNYSEALSRYYEYRTSLDAKLGIRPSPQLDALVQHLTVAQAGNRRSHAG